LDALAGPAHPEHVEYSAWAAEMTGAHEPVNPGFLDLEAVNRSSFWSGKGERARLLKPDRG
jgi:hypothetical protein